MIRNNTFAGGYIDKRAVSVSEGASPTVINNVINGAGSDSSSFTSGIACRGNAFIAHNIVFGWNSIGVYIDGGSPIIEHNLVINNELGFRIDWARSTPVIQNNTIAKNSVGIKLLDGPWPVFVNNNIQDNNNLNIGLQTENTGGNPEHDINATNNWWGTIDADSIDATFTDNKDDFNLGTVIYVPFLISPNPDAPEISTSIPNRTPTQSPSNFPSPTSSPTPIPVPGQSFFFVESNSTVSELFFNSTNSELSFTVSGPSGTTGHVQVTIAKSLVSSIQNLKVLLDGNELNFAITSNDDSWLLNFNYTHSSHHVNITLDKNVTGKTNTFDIEYWIWIISTVAVLVISIGLVYFKKRKKKP